MNDMASQSHEPRRLLWRRVHRDVLEPGNRRLGVSEGSSTVGRRRSRPVARSSRGGASASSGAVEAAVMDRVWAWDRPLLVREVLEGLRRDRGIAYTTVMMTVMEHLYRKGLLDRERDGRAYRYALAQSR